MKTPGVTKTLSPERLDKATPKWPEVRITLGDPGLDPPPPTTVTVSGVLVDVDDEAAALTRTAAQARTIGRPIRARISDHGAIRRVIVNTDGTVTHLDTPLTAAAAGVSSAAGSPPIAKPDAPKGPKKGRRPVALRSAGILGRFPAPLRPVIRWGAPVMGVLVLASVAVLIVKAASTDEPVGPPPVAAVPPPGELYTELAPPGWTQNAAWTVHLADDAPAPTVTPDGTIVAVTAEDRSAIPDVDGDRYLSVLEPDGRTRWAVPLPTAPRLGPVLARVDGVDVALIAGIRQLTYWPLTGGPETVVDLPSGARVAPTGLVELPHDQLAYLHDGALAVLDALPRTEPAIAVDGAVLVAQPDNGAWWTLRADQAPVRTVPTPPAGATGVERVITVAADHTFIAWTTDQRDQCLVAVYDTATGGEQAQTGIACGELPRTGAAYRSNNITAGIGTLILTGNQLTVANNATVTAVADQIYGTAKGDPAVINPDGTTTRLPDGTLTPVGNSEDHLLIVDGDQKLYGLQASK